MTEMLPQFDKADIEREQHHHHGSYAEEEEEIVQSLFCPGHVRIVCLKAVCNTLAERLVTAVDIKTKQPHSNYLEQEVTHRNVEQTEQEKPERTEIEC